MTSKTRTDPAKTATSEQPETAAPAVVIIKIGLDEFCLRWSKKDRRVETIGAFHGQETKAGRVEDTEAEFTARFVAFTKKPV